MYTEINGKRIHYECDGPENGGTVVLLNGIMMTACGWKRVIPALARTLRVVRLDFFNQGESSEWEDDPPLTLKDQAEAVLAVLDALGLTQATMAGWSYGGMVALELARWFPDRVSGLFLANTQCYVTNWITDITLGWLQGASNPQAFFDVALLSGFSQEYYSALNAEGREYLRSAATQPFLEEGFSRKLTGLVYSGEDFNARPYMNRIQTPTMILSAEFDHLTPVGQQACLAAGITGASHAVIPHQGHSLPFEKPELFAALLAGFHVTSKEWGTVRFG